MTGRKASGEMPRLMELELIRCDAKESTAGHRLAEQLGFGPNIDQPAGYFSGVASGITGNTLRYFTPDPLPDLLHRATTPGWKIRSERNGSAALLLLRAASRRPSETEPNFGQAQRIMSVLFEGRRFQSLEALIQLGGSISSKASQIREEIIFVGGPISSTARHIYAPYGALPDLMQSLVEGLHSQSVSECDPLVATAMVAAYCNYMHPFKDGNGRWARVVALSSAATNAHAWPSMTMLVFLNAARTKLTNEIFPQAATSGFRSYLRAASIFEDALTAELESAGAFEAATVVGELLQGAAKQQVKWRFFASKLFVSGRIEIEMFRQSCGVSKRVADGFADRMSAALPRFAERTKDHINIEMLLKNVDNAIQVAALSSQNP